MEHVYTRIRWDVSRAFMAITVVFWLMLPRMGEESLAGLMGWFFLVGMVAGGVVFQEEIIKVLKLKKELD